MTNSNTADAGWKCFASRLRICVDPMLAADRAHLLIHGANQRKPEARRIALSRAVQYAAAASFFECSRCGTLLPFGFREPGWRLWHNVNSGPSACCTFCVTCGPCSSPFLDRDRSTHRCDRAEPCGQCENIERIVWSLCSAHAGEREQVLRRGVIATRNAGVAPSTPLGDATSCWIRTDLLPKDDAGKLLGVGGAILGLPKYWIEDIVAQASRYGLHEFNHVAVAQYEKCHGDLKRALEFTIEEFENHRVPNDPREAHSKYAAEAARNAVDRDQRVYGPFITRKMGMVTERELPLPPLGLRKPRRSYSGVSDMNFKRALKDKRRSQRKAKTARIVIVSSDTAPVVEEVRVQ